MEFDEDLMIPDKSLSISQGAIAVTGWQSCTDKGSFTRAILDALANEYDFSLDTPFPGLSAENKRRSACGDQRDVLLRFIIKARGAKAFMM